MFRRFFMTVVRIFRPRSPASAAAELVDGLESGSVTLDA